MAKKKQEIKPITALRFKQLLAETGMPQAELAEKINLSQQTISKILNGKARLTEVNASMIASEFPEKNLLYQWLLGESDFQSSTEKIIAGLTEAQLQGNSELAAVTAMAKVLGYDVSLRPHGHESTPLPEDKEYHLFQLLSADYIISDSKGMEIELNVDEMSELQTITVQAFKECFEKYLNHCKEVNEMVISQHTAVEYRIDPTIEATEVRFNLESGKASIFAPNKKQAALALESLIKSNLL